MKHSPSADLNVLPVSDSHIWKSGSGDPDQLVASNQVGGEAFLLWNEIWGEPFVQLEVM